MATGYVFYQTTGSVKILLRDILSKIITAPKMGPKITWEREIQKQKIETLIFGHFKNVV
jgi:hypothetical protein